MSVKYVPLDYSENYANSLVLKYMVNKEREGFNLYGETKIFLPIYVADHLNEIENYKIHDSDVWIISLPKTGSTWIAEMAWLIGNDLDFKEAETQLNDRVHFFEYFSMTRKYDGFISKTNEKKNNTKSIRYMRSHLPWTLLPKQIQNGSVKPRLNRIGDFGGFWRAEIESVDQIAPPRQVFKRPNLKVPKWRFYYQIIYITRNPKDTCVSYFHHNVLLNGFSGQMDDMCELYLNNKSNYLPFWSHVNEYWKRKNQSNILYITYEETKTNMVGVIKKVADFLDKNITTKDVSKLCDHLSFNSMKNNPSLNLEDLVKYLKERRKLPANGAFIRKGVIGSHKTEMNPEYIKRFDDWIDKNLKLFCLPVECI